MKMEAAAQNGAEDTGVVCDGRCCSHWQQNKRSSQVTFTSLLDESEW